MNMVGHPELIVMLTHKDQTVENASEIFAMCKDTPVKYWGFKEKGIPLTEMKTLCKTMKCAGKTTVLEVVAYTEDACMDGAKMAADCGFDILMGTLFYDSVNQLCHEKNILYMPFVGQVSGRPSVLQGTPESMIAEAEKCLKKGVAGIDLLGYRYVGNATALNQQVTAQVDGPVCLAGSVDSYEKLDQVKRSGAWAFTIGSAFFENKFGEGFPQQIENVCRYLNQD